MESSTASAQPKSAFTRLSRPITKHLEKIGLQIPSEIQNVAIPMILDGKNILIISPTGCYDSKTEVLTKQGWKLFNEVRSDEEVLSMNPRTFVMHYVKAVGKIEQFYTGIMVHVEGKEIDFRVTEDHNMFLCRPHKKTDPRRYLFLSAGKISSTWRFKTDGIWRGKKQDYFQLPPLPKHWTSNYAANWYRKPRKIPMNKWLNFLGWYIAEGHCQAVHRKYTTTLCQSTYLKLIETAARAIGFRKVSISGPPNHRHFSICNAQLATYLSQFGLSYEKFVPNYIKQLNPNQIKIFLNAYHHGDGNIGRDGFSPIFDTTSKRLTDDVQELLLKIGISSSVRKMKWKPDCVMPDGHIRKQKHSYYGVPGRRRSEHGIDYRMRSKPRFEQVKAEKVYCLTLPKYHLLYVRRNGKALWCGNSGKTEASLLPVFHLFLEARSRHETSGISILYVTPLRALNRDIMRRVTEIGEELGIKVQVRHGDTTQSARAKQAKAPPEMLITTPETLQAILTGKKMLEHLKGVRWVVVDEIHELATDERGVQLSLALERLQHLTGRPFQRIGLSATVGEAEKVANFLGGTGREVVIAKAGEEKAFSIQVNYINPTAEDQRDADRLGLPAQTIARAKTIAKIIKEKKSTLVFTNTREHAEAVGSQIHALYEKLPVRVHHGSLSREVREEAEKDFQAGKVKAVICTSSLELGIDVGSVDFIVQYMSPRQSTTFVQRIGRSGHTLHGHSRGEIIGTTADDMLESAAITTCAASGNLERTLIHEKALDVLAHQIVGLALTEKRIPVGQVFDIVRGAYPYRALTMDELLDVIHFLESLRLIRVYDDVLAPAYPRSYGYYYENLSVIPDVKRFTVFDFFSKRRIGTLDQDFVARKCKPGTRTVFIMHGTTWRTVQTDEDRQTIDVEPTAPSLDAIPSWEGDMTPVSFEIAQTVGRLRARIAENINNAPALRKIREDINLTEAAMDRVVETIRTHMEHHPLPTDKHMVIEKFEHCIIIHTCLGSIVNETLAVTLAALLSARHGVSMITQVDPYRIALISRFRFEPEIVAQEIRKFVSEDFKPTFIQFLQNSDLFAWRNWQVARRFGVVERKADYFTGRARMIVKAMQGTPLTAETLRELLLEKFDLDAAVKIIGEIGSGEITVDLTSEWGQTCSPLAIPIVDKIIPHDLLRPALATKSLTDMVKERLYADTMRLVCMWNGDWDAIRIVGDLPERFKCPKCGSTLIAATYPRNDTLSAIVRKVKIGKTLTKEEKHTWQQGTKSASLVQTHGKKAVVVMTGRGIGPETATRVLRAPQHVEEELYATILKAERQYARTRLFWDGF